MFEALEDIVGGAGVATPSATAVAVAVSPTVNDTKSNVPDHSEKDDPDSVYGAEVTTCCK